MVGTPTTLLLVGVSERPGSSTQPSWTQWSTSSAAQEMRYKQQGSWRKGLNAENKLTPPSLGKNFLLTFPFIEPAHPRVSRGTVAVGIRITPYPPHRSVRAGFPHTALASG